MRMRLCDATRELYALDVRRKAPSVLVASFKRSRCSPNTVKGVQRPGAAPVASPSYGSAAHAATRSR